MEEERALPKFNYHLNPVENEIIVKRTEYVLCVISRQNMCMKDLFILKKRWKTFAPGVLPVVMQQQNMMVSFRTALCVERLMMRNILMNSSIEHRVCGLATGGMAESLRRFLCLCRLCWMERNC